MKHSILPRETERNEPSHAAEPIQTKPSPARHGRAICRARNRGSIGGQCRQKLERHRKSTQTQESYSLSRPGAGRRTNSLRGSLPEMPWRKGGWQRAESPGALRCARGFHRFSKDESRDRWRAVLANHQGAASDAGVCQQNERRTAVATRGLHSHIWPPGGWLVPGEYGPKSRSPAALSRAVFRGAHFNFARASETSLVSGTVGMS